MINELCPEPPLNNEEPPPLEPCSVPGPGGEGMRTVTLSPRASLCQQERGYGRY